MMKSDSLSRTYLYILFVLSIAGVLMAVVLMALIVGLDFMGFNGNTQISATCTGYFQLKYTQVAARLQQLAFVFSIFSLASILAVLILMVRCILQARKSEEKDVFVHRCMKISLYVLTSVAIMCAIPPFGYYVSFLAEINNCTSVTYDNSKISAILAMATILLAVLLAFFVLLFCALYGSSEEKYREVSNRQTEPNEEVKKAQEVQYLNKKRIEKEEPYRKEPQVYEKRTPQEMEKISPPKRVPNRGQDLQQTKQNLYNSPSRQPAINSYRKEPEQRPSYIQPAPERTQEPPKEPPPVLQPRSYMKESSYIAESPPRYAFPRRPPANQNGELMFHKERTKGPMGADDEEFSKEQSRYLNRYADRPILSSGVKEVNSRSINDGFYPGQLPRKTDANHPSRVRGGRQGNLVNYIRGKYAN